MTVGTRMSCLLLLGSIVPAICFAVPAGGIRQTPDDHGSRRRVLRMTLEESCGRKSLACP